VENDYRYIKFFSHHLHLHATIDPCRDIHWACANNRFHMAFYFLNVITEKTMLHLFAKPEIDMLFKYAIYIIALYNIKDKNQRSFYSYGEDGWFHLHYINHRSIHPQCTSICLITYPIYEMQIDLLRHIFLNRVICSYILCIKTWNYWQNLEWQDRICRYFSCNFTIDDSKSLYLTSIDKKNQY
jgi:hypothetical protein